MKLCPECERPLKQLDPTDPGCTVAKCSCGWCGEFRYGLDEPRIPNPKPALCYLSVDIETTGLDPETRQILEIGAVYDDWTKPMRDLPRFHCYVVHKDILGDPYALALNADTLRQFAGFQQDCKNQPSLTRPVTAWPKFLQPKEVAEAMAMWFGQLGFELNKSVTPAGKNFASFDRQFLKRLPDFEKKVRLSHRTFDPAPYFVLPTDDKLPDTKTCYERAGMNPKVAHTALEDALSVVQLLRVGVKRLRPC
jgi:oligoribonuclease (3'-5' exoribonuclease)